MRTSSAGHDWREDEFERWFVTNPVLPDDDRLLLLTRQRALRRVVDLLCLDADGRVVIIEVKNEATTRRALGQALEYVAALEGVTLDDLAEDYPGDLRSAFVATFGHQVTALSPQRRVILAAPMFDAPSALAARWLSEQLKHASVDFRLLAVRSTGESFGLSWYAGPQFVRAASLRKGTVVSPRGRLYQVLESGQRPVLWHIGRPGNDGQVRLPTGDALARRGIQVSARFYAPTDTPAAIDLSQMRSVWRYRARSHRARLLGVVTEAGRQVAVYACFREGHPTRVHRAHVDRFRNRWQPARGELPTWREIADMLQHDASGVD